MMMALNTSETTKIHTVDPNFPLEIEMSSMKSNMFDKDTTIKTQELARKVATQLGIEKKIVFHPGGFSTGATFASKIANSSQKVPVIGSDVCNNFGPFDFVFIDGLHYTDSVLSDLSLSSQYISEKGVISVHDVIGRWGSNVRRAVFEFLDKRTDFTFTHDNYSKIYNSIGFLQNRSNLTETACNNDVMSSSLVQEELLTNLVSALISKFNPISVIDIGCENDILLRRFQENNVTSVSGITTGLGGQEEHLLIKVHDFKGVFNPSQKYDLCVCLGLLEKLEPEFEDNLIQSCINASDTIIFSCTPPGEFGDCFPNQKPIAYWARKFYKKGYILHDTIKPYFEPLLYAETLYKVNSSFQMNIYAVKKAKKEFMEMANKDPDIIETLLEKESRIEDLALQNFFQNVLIEERDKLFSLLNKQHHNLNRQHHNLNKEYQSLIETHNQIISLPGYKFFAKLANFPALNKLIKLILKKIPSEK
jgi:hypothetical protein